MPPYSRKRQRESERAPGSGKRSRRVKGKIDRKKRRASSEAECIQLKKVCYEAVIQSAAKPTLPQEEREQAPERERVRASNA
jgi:hypothetical protein